MANRLLVRFCYGRKLYRRFARQKIRKKPPAFCKGGDCYTLTKFGGLIESLGVDTNFNQLISKLFQMNWVVYSKPPFKSPAYVLRYLGRYIHRVAISNHRIISVQNGQVTFKWRDYKDKNREKLMTVSVFEFMRRFLLHVLPLRFVKIRYYGFLSNRIRKIKIRLCQKFLNMAIQLVKPLSNLELITKLLGFDPSICPCCGKGKMIRRILGAHAPPQFV